MNVIVRVLNGAHEHNKVVLTAQDESEVGAMLEDIEEFIKDSFYEIEEEGL